MSTNLKQLTLSKYIETLLATIEITNNKTINEILYQLKKLLMKIIFNLQNDISLLDKRGDSLMGLRDEFAVQAIGVSFVFIFLFTFICLIMILVIDV